MEHFRVQLICEQSKNIVGHLMDNKGKEKKKIKQWWQWKDQDTQEMDELG